MLKGIAIRKPRAKAWPDRNKPSIWKTAWRLVCMDQGDSLARGAVEVDKDSLSFERTGV
jgi:hypothetical protein